LGGILLGPCRSREERAGREELEKLAAAGVKKFRGAEERFPFENIRPWAAELN
jgi:hypothetical protein